jgi:hypothetical protein
LVSHSLHGNRLSGDTLFRNLHQPLKSVGLETPEIFCKVNELLRGNCIMVQKLFRIIG